MAWGKAGSTTTTSSASSMDSGTMSASKFNQILCHVSGLSASTFCETKFNSSTSGYDSVAKQNNGTDFSRLSQSDLNMFESYSNTTGAFLVSYFSNISGQEKLGVSSSVREANSAVSALPEFDEVGYVWNTTDQITSMSFTPQSGTIDTDSNLSILGSNVTTATAQDATVTDGAIFYETDTDKEYVLYNNTWTEV